MPASSAAEADEPMSRSERMFVGLVLLCMVDLIWVASSELTGYIFNDLKYDKPYFSTYFKSSLFSSYLVLFAFYRPWQRQLHVSTQNLKWMRRRPRYSRVKDSDDLDFDCEDDQEASFSTDAEVTSAVDDSALPRTSVSQRPPLSRSLSSPTWIPANIPESSKSSGTESEGEEGVGGRRVRFQNVAQVVEMNPADALYANLARLSYNASLRAQAAIRRARSRLAAREVAMLALVFAPPFFAGNYCYQAALSDTDIAVVNVLSSTSCFFTLLLAAAFPSGAADRITLSKLLAVSCSFAGAVLVSYADASLEPGGGFPSGAAWSLAGALCYSTYLVLLRRMVGDDANLDCTMFMSFVGLFIAALFWPGLMVLNATGAETFEEPNGDQWRYLLINGCVGTILSETLWLWGCFYTSSLVATLAISLTIPLSVAADVLWRGREYGATFVAGAVPMFVAFFMVAMLTHYEDWDPVMDLCTASWQRCKRLMFLPRTSAVSTVGSNSVNTAYVFENQEERESLLQESSRERDVILIQHQQNQQDSSHDEL